jgi:exopolyphosphatase/guanosine-5'-triphosphate,3'-diphosphate pyrophosphatase
VKQEHGKAVVPSSSSDATASGRSSASESTTRKDGPEPSGRRKRRRRKSARKGEIVNAPAGPTENTPSAETAAAPGGGKKGRRRRRKSGREIQGRPLTSQKTPGQPHARQQAGASAQPGAGAQAKPAAPSGQGVRRQADDLYAALDLGTNNCRLLVAQPTRPGQFRVVDAFSRIVRLGEGLMPPASCRRTRWTGRSRR